MALAQSRILEVYFEGEQGHNGNVLANDFLAKFQKFLAILYRMERVQTGARSRKTDYEIVEAEKYNPTVHKLKAVPKVKDYDPSAAFDWTVSQFHAVANDLPVDRSIDATVLKEMTELASRPQAAGYSRFWFKADDNVIHLDEAFERKANAAFLRARAEEAPIAWHVGVAVGEVTGSLDAVSNLEGEQEFVISPSVGPSRIQCKYPEGMHEEMRRHLFKVVTVEGLLHYGEASPHPYLVEMTKISARPMMRRHLLDLRGAFEGVESSSEVSIHL